MSQTYIGIAKSHRGYVTYLVDLSGLLLSRSDIYYNTWQEAKIEALVVSEQMGVPTDETVTEEYWKKRLN